MITIDIVTPVRKLIEGLRVDSVKIPGADGELQLLPGHTDLLTLLSTGPLSFVQDGKERKFAVSYGFAEIRKDRVLILAETVEESTAIDKERASKSQKRAEETLGGVLEEGSFNKQQMKLQRAILRQNVSR